MLIAMVKSDFRHIKKGAPQKPSPHSESYSDPLDFHENHSIDTVFHSDYDALIRFSPHSKLWRPEVSKVFFGGRGTPLDFHKNQGICAVFHADCDGEIRFSPHSKMVPPETAVQAPSRSFQFFFLV